MPTAAEISQTFEATFREIAAHDAEALSRALKPYGSLGMAIAALREDDCFDLHGKALALEAAQAEVADPTRLARRLRKDAEFHRASAASHLRDIPELESRRTWASVRDVPASLEQLQRRIDACIACAEACEQLADQAEARANAVEVVLVIGKAA